MAVTAFGKYLRKLRIERDLLLKDMADTLNISSAQLSAMELGNRAIQPEIGIKLASAYGLDDMSEIGRLIDISQPSLKTDLKDANDTQREVMVMFARAFTDMSNDQLTAIQDIMNKVK